MKNKEIGIFTRQGVINVNLRIIRKLNLLHINQILMLLLFFFVMKQAKPKFREIFKQKKKKNRQWIRTSAVAT